MRKKIFLFFFILTAGLASAQTAEYSCGIYWTYEDYQNNKLEVKGKLVNLTKLGSLLATFENAQGEKEKVNISKAFGFTDHRGTLWRSDPKHSAALRTVVKGDACLYINAFDCAISMKDMECDKKGKPKFYAAVFYVSKGINGEVVYGPGKVKKIIEDSPEAMDVLKNASNLNNVFEAYAAYNKLHPLPGDYLYPECEEVVK